MSNDRREDKSRQAWKWAAIAAALFVLNAVVTFHNVWPTPFVWWNGGLSIELAACVLVLWIVHRWRGAAAERAVRPAAWVWAALVIGRYAAVTTPALYGRDVNLYWDARHLSAVAAMLARPAQAWIVVAVVAAVVVVPLLLYLVSAWGFRQVWRGLERPAQGLTLAIAAAAAIAVFVAQRVDPRVLPVVRFPTPVTESYAAQAALVAREFAAHGRRPLGPATPLDSDLSRVAGADVFLIFVESYGAVSYDRREFADQLAASRARFENDVAATGRDIRSAFVESPTFGGSSWLAHISLLSGIEVRDEDTNRALMAEKRDTLVTTFSRRGYRTLAVMPGLQERWPEGAFYGFDQVYGTERLGYTGPQFGWWTIPDQFAVARMDTLAQASRIPLFVFLPTTSTHTPFGPTAPYQPDWSRMFTSRPYDDRDMNRIWSEQADWLNMGPSYVHALSYAYAVFGGYLRHRPDRDFVMILIGDHQPPAAVSGEGAAWDVPVHVIASRTRRRDVLDRLSMHGFQPGLTPARPTVSRMNALLPTLLDAFGDTP